MIVIDTHVLLWLALAPEKIGALASDTVQKATRAQEVHVATITAWEIATIASKGRIFFTVPVATWIRDALAQPGIRLAQLTPEIAIDAGLLPEGIHGDPGDRIIVATARALRCPLMTADEKILAYAAAGHVQVIDARR